MVRLRFPGLPVTRSPMANLGRGLGVRAGVRGRVGARLRAVRARLFSRGGVSSDDEAGGEGDDARPWANGPVRVARWRMM